MKTKNLSPIDIANLVSYSIGGKIIYYSDIESINYTNDGDKICYHINLKTSKKFSTFKKEIYDEIVKGKNEYEFYLLNNVKSDFEDKVKKITDEFVTNEINDKFKNIFEDLKSEYVELFCNTSSEAESLLSGLKTKYTGIFENVSNESLQFLDELKKITGNKTKELENFNDSILRNIVKAKDLTSEYGNYLSSINGKYENLNSFLNDTDWKNLNKNIKDTIHSIAPVKDNLNLIIEELEKLVKL